MDYTLDHGWETMVFASDENGNVSSWMDLDCDIYATESQANEGHEKWLKNGKICNREILIPLGGVE